MARFSALTLTLFVATSLILAQTEKVENKVLDVDEATVQEKTPFLDSEVVKLPEGFEVTFEKNKRAFPLLQKETEPAEEKKVVKRRWRLRRIRIRIRINRQLKNALIAKAAATLLG